MSRQRSLSVLAIAAGLIGPSVVGVPAAHAGVMTVRYAAPNGSPANSCAATTPCDLLTAINGAGSAADVVIEPGAFYADDPLTTELTSTYPLTVHAADPAHVPVIYTAAATGLLLADSHVADIAVVTTSALAGVRLNGGGADHIAVFAAAGRDGACELYDATLSDSLCAQAGDHDPAIGTTATTPASQANVLRNVTAVATGTGGYAFYGVGSNSTSTSTSTVTNTILHGAGGDVSLAMSGSGAMTMKVNHSAYRPTSTDTTRGGQIIAGNGNVSAAPKFVAATAADFREKPSSPTVDAGARAAPSDVDLNNLPRTIGKTTDIGAFELAVPPKVRHLMVLEAARHTATIRVTVNGQGMATQRTATVTASAANTEAKTESLDGRPHTARIEFHHLKRHRRYAVRVVASNQGGTTSSKVKHVRTK